MVHFEAKRLGLRGLRDEEIPKLRQALSRRWLTIIPFLSIIYMIFLRIYTLLGGILGNQRGLGNGLCQVICWVGRSHPVKHK